MPEKIPLDQILFSGSRGGGGLDNILFSNPMTSPAQRQNRESVIKLIAPVMKAIQSQSTGLKDRAKTAVIGGLPASAAGVKPEQAANAADFVTPSVLSTLGAPAGIKGMALGASAGRAINEIGKRALNLPQSQSRPVLGFGPMAPGPVNDVISEGLWTAIGAKAIDKAGRFAGKIAPQMKSRAIETAQKILKPGGKLRDKSAQIAENAIKYDVLRDDLTETAGLVEGKIGQLDDALESLIKQYQNNRMSGDEVVNSLDEIADFYTKNAAPDQAAKVASLRDEFISAHQLQKPVIGMIKKTDSLGAPYSETGVIGKEARQIPVSEAQSLKRGQYELLKKMRSDGGYNVQTQAPEIMGRQAAARAYKEGVARNVPGADALNTQMSELLDIGAATNARLPVAQRNNFFDLGDVVMASNGQFNLGAARKVLGLNRAKIAKKLYSGSGKVAKAGKKLTDPLVQVISQYPSRLLSVLGDN